jgi:transketolase
LDDRVSKNTVSTSQRPNVFDAAASARRCVHARRRILDISQQVSALHAGGAFSAIEIVDTIYHGLMRRHPDGSSPDTFLMSKGHGCMAQYVALEAMGVLNRADLDLYCKPGGRLGCHPDYGVPGIEASTGSLGHGMALAVGMAYTDICRRDDRDMYVVLSDGELQEGSTWESMMMAANLGVDRLIALLDHNGSQSFGHTRETHPKFYPIREKVEAFGWECTEADGHDVSAMHRAALSRRGGRPFLLIAHTVKGRGVSFMEHQPVWHYRSPTKDEYAQAIAELSKVAL